MGFFVFGELGVVVGEERLFGEGKGEKGGG